MRPENYPRIERTMCKHVNFQFIVYMNVLSSFLKAQKGVL